MAMKIKSHMTVNVYTKTAAADRSTSLTYGIRVMNSYFYVVQMHYCNEWLFRMAAHGSASLLFFDLHLRVIQSPCNQGNI